MKVSSMKYQVQLFAKVCKNTRAVQSMYRVFENVHFSQIIMNVESFLYGQDGNQKEIQLFDSLNVFKGCISQFSFYTLNQFHGTVIFLFKA